MIIVHIIVFIIVLIVIIVILIIEIITKPSLLEPAHLKADLDRSSILHQLPTIKSVDHVDHDDGGGGCHDDLGVGDQEGGG